MQDILLTDIIAIIPGIAETFIQMLAEICDTQLVVVRPVQRAGGTIEKIRFIDNSLRIAYALTIRKK